MREAMLITDHFASAVAWRRDADRWICGYGGPGGNFPRERNTRPGIDP